MTPKPDWEAFGRAIMAYWPDISLYGFDIQDIAERHKIILPVPGGYDPEQNIGGECWGCEPGDPWFKANYTSEAKA